MEIRHRTRKVLLSGSLLAGSAALPEGREVIGAGHRTQFRLLRTRLQPRRRENPLGIGRSERTRITRLLPGRKDNVHKRHQEQHYGSRCFKRKLHSALEYTDAV